MKILFVWPNKDSFGYKPIGLSLLASIARAAGWKVHLFDTTEIDFGFMDNSASGMAANIFKPVDMSKYSLHKKPADLRHKFLKALKEFKPDCLAVSVLSDEFLIASQISKIFKEEYPRLPVIWGGKYPTLNPEKALEEFNADFVCIGEGLEAFEEFLNALSGNADLYRIRNIWAKRNGETIKNAIRPLRRNLDDLPYTHWDIFDKRHFYKIFDGNVYKGGDHMLNWGCPYRCTYCINHYYHRLYDNKYVMRRYGIKRIVEELKYLKDRHALGFFKFHDEDFLMRPIDNLRELSEAYKQEVGVPFVIETNPRSVTREKVKLLRQMNCVSASVAIETGNTGLRKKLLNRVDTEDDVVRAFKLLKEENIRTSSFNLLAIPFESRATFKKTISLNRKANVQYPNIGFFYPFEGTALRDISIKEGFFDPLNKDTIVYRHDRPALHFSDLSEKELVEMRNVFVLYVKLPKPFEPFIKRSEISDALGVKIRKRLLDIFNETIVKNNGWYASNGCADRYISELKMMEERGSKK